MPPTPWQHAHANAADRRRAPSLGEIAPLPDARCVRWPSASAVPRASAHPGLMRPLPGGNPWRTIRIPGRWRRPPDNGFERIDGFLLNAVPDVQDLRDYPYVPALVQLRSELQPPKKRSVLNQGREGACTGFGLAAVINRLLAERGEVREVSARMLYEMAKKFDKWEGEGYVGSSCRGAVRGWSNMGVCSEALAPYQESESNWHLTIEQAKDARKTTVGAYFRVSKRLSDYHAALNEVGVLYASARVHDGWRRSNVVNGDIPHRAAHLGNHAFAIVGYNQEGFYVQNSWGKTWGNDGVALWLYEDWLENIRDAWVVRLALSTPQVWHLGPSAGDGAEREEGLFSRKPNRGEILGHFVHLDDGDFDDDDDRYWSDLATVEETAKLVAESNAYDHLLLYAHGGLNSPEASARRIVAMKDIFKQNGIYPFHFMYDTGLLEEIKDVVLGRKRRIDGRTRGIVSDWTDRQIEKLARKPGRAIWREMKQGARSPFRDGMADGTRTIRAFLEAFSKPGARARQIHLVGHSTGAILLAALLEALGKEARAPVIETCSLMAPACTHQVFKEVYRPLLDRRAAPLRIDRLAIYNLSDALEQDDTVTVAYRKSLLYLVSNSFEAETGQRLLGMQKFRRFLGVAPTGSTFRIEVSNGSRGPRVRTASKTHGGFDEDPFTMNDILRAVLKGVPVHPFTEENLKY